MPQGSPLQPDGRLADLAAALKDGRLRKLAISLALAPGVARLGRFDLVPEDWHAPLQQRMVLLAKPPAKAPPAARAFHDELATAAALATLARYGFVAPRD